jgi:hypothetical protein
MSNYAKGQRPSIFDLTTGLWVGLLDLNGRAQFLYTGTGNYVLGETSHLFDAATGAWAGVVDYRGREQIVNAGSSNYIKGPAPWLFDPSTGQLYGVLDAKGREQAVQAATSNLYAASAESYLPTSTVTLTGSDTMVFVASHTIGSAHRKNLVVSFDARSGGADRAGYTVMGVWLINPARTIAVQCLFGGAATKVVNSGDIDIQTDAVLPSQFSIPRFTVGEKWFIKAMIRTTLGATLSAAEQRVASTSQDFQYMRFDSSVTTATGEGTPGGWGWTGTTPSNIGTRTFNPILLGAFDGAPGQVWYAVHDSIGLGFQDATPSGNSRRGLFGRALFGNGTTTQMAGIWAGYTGMAQANWLGDAKAQYFLKYCTHGYLQTLTNDFNSSGTSITLATAQARDQSAIALFNAAGIPSTKIVRNQLLQRIGATTDSYATEAGQTVSGAGWGAGGNIPLFNDWTLTQVGVLWAAVYTAPEIRGVDKTKWISNGTANYVTGDGLHPNGTGHALLEAPLRAVFDSVPT